MSLQRPRAYGLRDTLNQSDILTGIDKQIQDRAARIQFLQDYGEVFWLPVSLGLPSPAAAAGAVTIVTSNNQDFDILLYAAWCNLRLSSVEIIDSARNRSLTNGAVNIPAIANFATTGGVIGYPFEWEAPYLLPAKAQLTIRTTADGTETGGTLVFKCKQPPVYQG